MHSNFKLSIFRKQHKTYSTSYATRLLATRSICKLTIFQSMRSIYKIFRTENLRRHHHIVKSSPKSDAMDLLRGLRQGMHQGPSLSGLRHHSNISTNSHSHTTTDNMDVDSPPPEDPGSYAVIVRMGYRDLRFDVPVLISEDAVFEIVRKRMGPPPAAAEFVKTLPTSTVSPDGTEADGGHTCVICQDQFAVGEGLTTMPCKHIFHSECLHPWLAMHNTCPTCRVPVPAEEDALKKRVQSEVSSGADAVVEDEEEEGVIMLNDEDIREMRQRVPVRNLKALIAQAGGETKGVVEKDELFLRYLQCLDRQRVGRQEQLRQQRDFSTSAA